MAWRFEPPPDASTAMRELIARILRSPVRRWKRREKTIDRFAQIACGSDPFTSGAIAVFGGRRFYVEHYRHAAERRGGCDVAPSVPREKRSGRIDVVFRNRLAVERQPGLAALARP